MNVPVKANKYGLPEMFRSLMWSYKFEAIDPAEHWHELVVNAINYGDLKHWRWLKEYYGKDHLREILEGCLNSEFSMASRKLVKLMFGVRHFQEFPRGRTHCHTCKCYLVRA